MGSMFMGMDSGTEKSPTETAADLAKKARREAILTLQQETRRRLRSGYESTFLGSAPKAGNTLLGG